MTKKTEKEEAVTAVPAAEPVEARKSDVIWNKIKDLPIEMFALADQEVHMWCTREVAAEPDFVYLVLKSTAVLPALEEAIMKLNPKKLKEKEFKNMTFEFSQAHRYTTVKLVPKPPQ